MKVAIRFRAEVSSANSLMSTYNLCSTGWIARKPFMFGPNGSIFFEFAEQDFMVTYVEAKNL
jgi:hypothetical protein